MAKTPRDSKGADSSAQEGKKPARSGSNINLYVDDDIREAMDRYMSEHNAKNEHPATLRSTVEAALKLYLKAKGHWPPKAAD